MVRFKIECLRPTQRIGCERQLLLRLHLLGGAHSRRGEGGHRQPQILPLSRWLDLMILSEYSEILEHSICRTGRKDE